MLHKVVCQVASVHPKDSDAQPGGVDDMTKLCRLHEPGVFYNLASRYELDNIYVSAALSHYASVYTCNILIAVNPFAKLPHLLLWQIKVVASAQSSVAVSCCRAMINEKQSQSILVSGETRAGKTEIDREVFGIHGRSSCY
ncbi:unnamed protein product [Sphagnum troendelagicum]|uniref:Myosin motor domain-containing protein n=1 Tax=Sphagnum troendelagicum TaxID=128251 RepID=A0ABP0UJE0_9BRYO